MRPVRKIDLFISSLRGGGAERVCTTLANGLNAKGYDVRLVVLNLKNAKYQDQLSKEIKLINLQVSHARTSIWAINNYIQVEKPKKILVFNPQIAIVLVMLRMIKNYNFSLVSRNINTISQRRLHQKSIWHKHIVHKIISLLYKKVDIVIAQSHGMAEDLIQNYGFSPQKVNVIFNPVSQQIVERSLSEKQEKSYNQGDLLYVGRFSQEKGIYFLLEAFRKCILNHSITLHLIGEGPLAQDIENYISEYGLQNHIKISKFTNDIYSHFFQARLTLLSSYTEGFPNVLIESITIGTPVVSFDCPSGPKDIIIEGKNGFLAEYLNVDDLALKIEKALATNWKKEQIQETGDKFTTEKITQKYIDLLERSSEFAKQEIQT